MQEEGILIKEFNGTTHKDCERYCDEKIKEGCRSFGYCPNWKNGGCFLYDKNLYGTETLTKRTDCYTNYRNCEGNSNTLGIYKWT